MDFAKNPKDDAYERSLASLVYKLFGKKSATRHVKKSALYTGAGINS